MKKIFLIVQCVWMISCTTVSQNEMLEFNKYAERNFYLEDFEYRYESGYKLVYLKNQSDLEDFDVLLSKGGAFISTNNESVIKQGILYLDIYKKKYPKDVIEKFYIVDDSLEIYFKTSLVDSNSSCIDFKVLNIKKMSGDKW